MAVPNAGAIAPETMPGLIRPTAIHSVKFQAHTNSLLAYNFNSLWAAALNERERLGLTHFAMMHADIGAGPLWLDTLLEEMDRVDADVLSVVVPLKDDRGLTSTGIFYPKTQAIQRLTMAEVATLPRTFCNRDLDTGNPLAINTGLWVCRFTESWIEDVCFTIKDWMDKKPDGAFWPRVLSEDWLFSAWLADRGLSVYATTIVAINHIGRHAFPNNTVWGDWTSENGDPNPAAPILAAA